ncbi:MAG: hypothetical protein SVK08_01740 [Halobacteriota archaeon]|nr:hypothetical protein [Halobacteriota archaeon]
MRTPEIYSAQQIREWDTDRESDCHGWIPARPMSRYGVNLIWRLQLAWYVFIGKADALGWQDQGGDGYREAP